MEPMKPLISVVMVTYHTGPALWQAIHSVLAQEGATELIVVNNGNPPDVVIKLRHMAEENPAITIISGQGNAGFARGCNLGAEMAKGDYILLLNPDCILPPSGAMELIRALASHNGMLAGGYLQYPDGTEQRGSRRTFLDPSNALVESLWLHTLFPQRFGQRKFNSHDDAVPDHITEIDVISGACMMLSLSDYKMLGGMDEGYFLHVEDMDFCKRVQNAGGKTLFVPHVKITHFRSTSNAPSSVVEWHKTKGFIRYFYIHAKHIRYAWCILPLMTVLAWLRFGFRVSGWTLRRMLHG